MAGRIASARHKARALRTIDKADNTVVTQHERLRELTNRRPTARAAAAHREQQLMLRRGQTMSFRLLLAPMQKATQAGAQLQQLCVLLLGQIIMGDGHIYRDTISESEIQVVCPLSSRLAGGDAMQKRAI